MGYFKAANGTQSFSPDNTPNTLYIPHFSETNLSEILDAAKSHFGDDVKMDDLNVSIEHIHTECLGYDQYDPSDYTNYFVITRDTAHTVG